MFLVFSVSLHNLSFPLLQCFFLAAYVTLSFPLSLSLLLFLSLFFLHLPLLPHIHSKSLSSVISPVFLCLSLCFSLTLSLSVCLSLFLFATSLPLLKLRTRLFNGETDPHPLPRPHRSPGSHWRRTKEGGATTADPVDKTPSSQCRVTSSIPGRGTVNKIPTYRNRACAATTESTCSRAPATQHPGQPKI